MTLALRNTVIYVGVAIALILLISFSFAGYQMLANPISPVLPSEYTWLVWSWQVRANDVVFSLAATGALGAIAVVALMVSARVFRRVSSAEVYFFALFLIGLAFEQLRVVQLYLLQLQLPAAYGALLTRLIVAARIGGGFSFFVASLYAVGIDYPRIGTLTIAIGLLAFLFVYFVPVDTVTVSSAMLNLIAGQSSLELVLLIVGGLGITNYLIAGVRGHRERGSLVALAAIALVFAREVAWFVPGLAWIVAGVVLFAYGVTTFILVTRAHYLWY